MPDYTGQWILVPSSIGMPEYLYLPPTEQSAYHDQVGGTYNHAPHHTRHYPHVPIEGVFRIVKPGGEGKGVDVHYALRPLHNIPTITGEWLIRYTPVDNAISRVIDINPDNLDKRLESWELLKIPKSNGLVSNVRRIFSLNSPLKRIGQSMKGVTAHVFMPAQ